MIDRLLVSGACTPLGQAVIAQLLDALQLPPDRLIAVAQAPERIEALRRRGVRVRVARPERPADWPAALAGAGRVLLLCLATAQPLFDAVLATGVRHIVCAQDICGEAQHRALSRAGIDFSVLRIARCFEDLQEMMASSERDGVWATAMGDGVAACVARDDAARAVAAALLRARDVNAVVDITGPQALSAQLIASAFSQEWGRNIRVEPLAPPELQARARATGEPERRVRLQLAFDAVARAGELAQPGPGVLALTGAAPITLRQHLRRPAPPVSRPR